MKSVALLLPALLAGCPLPPDEIIRDTVRQTGCASNEIRLTSRLPIDRGLSYFWTAQCRGVEYSCEHRNDVDEDYCAPIEPRTSAPTTSSERPLSPEEVLAVLSSAEVEALECVRRAPPAPPSITLAMQVNGDGSAIYLGTDPSAPPEVAACMRSLVGTLRFRATGAPPRTVTTPPLHP